MVPSRRTGRRWIPGWLLMVGAAGVPLATSVTCDSSDLGITVFRDRGYRSDGFFDVFVDDHFFFDDCFFDDCF